MTSLCHFLGLREGQEAQNRQGGQLRDPQTEQHGPEAVIKQAWGTWGRKSHLNQVTFGCLTLAIKQ